MSDLNLNLWTIAGYIVGSDLPPQYEFIQAFVVVILLLVFVYIICSPFIIVNKLVDR